MPAINSLPSVLGDFVFGTGPGVYDWMRTLEGFQLTTSPDEAAHAALRGAARSGNAPDGTRWVTLDDLIQGNARECTAALSAGSPPHANWRGRFGQVIWHPGKGKVVAVTDHFGTLPLNTLVAGEVCLIATDLRLLAASPWCDRSIDLESIYHYLNFAVIPAPRTIFRAIRRLEPSTRATWERERQSLQQERYFIPEYPEDLRDGDATLARELRERIVETVREYGRVIGERAGAFLSGGTDSSSIVTILARQVGPGKLKSFSIGFAEQAFDELAYARLAASACQADAHFAKVSRQEAQALVPRIIEAYDQPFGNASSIPTLACADMARAGGIELLIAGDGGDEIFGGNERYAKDKIMQAWFGLPEPVKRAGKGLGALLAGRRSHFLNRVDNFFERASLPNPDRFYTDESFASDHYSELLTDEFRRGVERNASLEHMRRVFQIGRSGSPLHRIMRLDLHMAIAQNDIPKVHCATKSAGISTRFPFLDPALLAYTSRLPAHCKVRRLQKRYLFKLAMSDVLPQEILRKTKQGFGLPIADWLRSDSVFRSSVESVLFDPAAKTRDWWQRDFVKQLLEEHQRGSWDHADRVWRLFVLELWLNQHGPRN